MEGDEDLRLTDQEIAQCFTDPAFASKFPPVLRTGEAADLIRVPTGTLRDWRSRGLLAGCCRRVGKQVLYFRDRLIKKIFNEGLGD
jgi:hypothetical protein